MSVMAISARMRRGQRAQVEATARGALYESGARNDRDGEIEDMGVNIVCRYHFEPYSSSVDAPT